MLLPARRLQAGCLVGRRLHPSPKAPVPATSPACVPVDCYRRVANRFLVIGLSGADDAVTDAAVDPRSRRQQRAERRAARRPSTESQQPSLEQEAPVRDTDSDAADDPAPSQPSRLSRIAARRAQRSRGKRRVPAALVPDEDFGSDSDESEDDDYSSADLSDEQQLQLEDDEAGAAAGAGSSDDDSQIPQQIDSSEAMSQLPSSVLDAAILAGRKSHKSASVSQPGSSPHSEPIILRETNSMYVPVLTDEDLEKDPPGHKSGYVAVIGRPNAGKSTLINAIVGQKLSIVTFKPQTTRHRVVGIASAPDYQMILFDTPGIMHEQRTKLDERMMAAVVSSIKAAEVIIAVVDSGDNPQEALAMFQPGPDWDGPPMAVLLNKSDLLEAEQVEKLSDWYKTNCRAEQVFVGSALSSTDEGVAAIKQWVVGKLPEGPTLYPKSMVSEQPERFFVSEMIREQIFLQYDKEIPYACQVLIEDFKEWPGKRDHIKAVILVERESQVPILLGMSGSRINKLGIAARKEIEEFLGRPVYLELSVKVAPSWRQQQDKLKEYGYFDPLYIT